MGNGESSTILLLLNFYANSSSTLSVFSYPLSISQSSDAVVGLLTNNRSWRHAFPLLKLYYFNASHVGQKTNMGLRTQINIQLSDLVNGQW
jgi:hypothetical protein